MKQKLSLLAMFFILIFTACDNDDFKGKACFTFTPDGEITVGDVVTFSNCSSDAGYFLWSFGDNTTSIEENPTHTYNQPGTFTISLAAQDEEFKDINGDMIINEQDRLTQSNILTFNVIVIDTN